MVNSSKRVLPPLNSSISVISDQPSTSIFSMNLTQGDHTLEWVFTKKSPSTDPTDMATVNWIMLVGAESDSGVRPW